MANETTPLTGGADSEAIQKKVHKVYDMKVDGADCQLCAMGFSMNNLYDQVPSVCFMGMQAMEHKAEDAAVEYAVDMLEEQEGRVETGDFTATRRQTIQAVHNRVIREVTQAAFSWPLNLAVLTAVLAQLLVGYNIGVMNAPEKVVFPDHTTAEWSLAVAAFAAGGPFGANIAGTVADRRGRRTAILASAWMFLLGGLLQSVLATNIQWIIGARLVIGFASGFTSVVIPIYLGELAPPSLRGTLGTVTQFATVTGILVSNLVAFPLAKPGLYWRILFGINAVIAVGILVLSPWLLESPRWLLQKDSTSERARTILADLRNLSDGRLIETEVVHLLTATKTQGGGTSISLGDILSDPSHRRLMISAIVYHVAQQLSGINAVFYYSNSFFEGVIDNPFVGTAIVGAVNVAATYVALLVMETTDRRALLIISSGGMMICSVILVLSLLGYLSSSLIALGAVNLYVIFFELGLGPIPWLIVPELFDAKYVALAMSTATQINWVFNFVVGLVYPFMQKSLGPYSFGPFAVFLLLTLLYTVFFLPETRGKTPTEIYTELAAKRPLKDLHVN